MSRVFCIPGIFFLLLAVVASFLASISLPTIPALDMVRVKFPNTTALDTSSDAITELRFGIWTACTYDANESKTCMKSGYAYEVTVNSPNVAEAVTVGASWTRGLVVTPVATAVTLIALCLSLSTNLFVMLLASLTSFLAAALNLISFFIQIALFARVKDKMGDLDVDANTKPGPGFWLVFASLILCLLAGCTVCFGRRRDQNLARGAEVANAIPPTSDEKKSGFLSKFKN